MVTTAWLLLSFLIASLERAILQKNMEDHEERFLRIANAKFAVTIICDTRLWRYSEVRGIITSVNGVIAMRESDDRRVSQQVNVCLFDKVLWANTELLHQEGRDAFAIRIRLVLGKHDL